MRTLRTVVAALATAVLGMGLWLLAGAAGAEPACVELDAGGFANAHPDRVCREIFVPTTCVSASLLVPMQRVDVVACHPD